MRAEAVLASPPHAFKRCARVWEKHVSKEGLGALHAAQFGLYDAINRAAKARAAAPGAELPDEVLGQLASALALGERTVQSARLAAVESASSRPWGAAMRGAKLERADDREAVPLDRYNGKLVALYYTASWCGPCRQFSPHLVALHSQVQAAGSGAEPFDVLMVSWDEDAQARQAYAARHGMRWAACSGEVADELTLRYDVKSIPAIVVVEVSEDGSQARLVSSNGRVDLAQYATSGKVEPRGWLSRLGFGLAKTPPSSS